MTGDDRSPVLADRAPESEVAPDEINQQDRVRPVVHSVSDRDANRPFQSPVRTPDGCTERWIASLERSAMSLRWLTDTQCMALLTPTGWERTEGTGLHESMRQFVLGLIESERATARAIADDDERKKAVTAVEAWVSRASDPAWRKKMVDSIVAMPGVKTTEGEADQSNAVAFRNGVLYFLRPAKTDVPFGDRPMSDFVAFEPWSSASPLMLNNTGHVWNPDLADERPMREFVDSILVDADNSPDSESHRMMQAIFGRNSAGGRADVMPWLLGNDDPAIRAFLPDGANGANGKTTLMEILGHAFGTYSVRIDDSLVVARRGSRVNDETERARLRGTRVALCDDATTDGAVSIPDVKQLVDARKIRGRNLFERAFDFAPQFVLAISSNERPRLNSFGNAEARRFRVLTFRSVFLTPGHFADAQRRAAERGEQLPAVVKQRDETVSQALLDNPMAIWAWLIRGYAMALDGIEQSASSREVWDEWVADSDHLQQFVDACLVAKPGARLRHSSTGGAFIAAGTMFGAYAAWCTATGLDHPLTAVRLARELPKRRPPVSAGWVRGSTDGLSVWVGVGIRQDGDSY